MHRDSDIQRVFETADDSFQGIIGYRLYTAAMQDAVDPERILQFLPRESFQTTFSWIRYYQRHDLVKAFEKPKLEFYQSRILLVSLTSIFDATLLDFIQHLHRKGSLKSMPRNNYKPRIEWAYETSLGAKIGEKAAIERLPRTFGIIDNARRLRNLLVHNQGLFRQKYERDAIKKKGMIVDLHPFYEVFRENPEKPVPVVINWNYLQRLILAHIEVLHILHNEVQRKFFGVSKGYSYAREGKPIVWERVLWGRANVRLIHRKVAKSSNIP